MTLIAEVTNNGCPNKSELLREMGKSLLNRAIILSKSLLVLGSADAEELESPKNRSRVFVLPPNQESSCRLFDSLFVNPFTKVDEKQNGIECKISTKSLFALANQCDCLICPCFTGLGLDAFIGSMADQIGE